MGVTVLLVEDEHSIGALVRTYLERDGRTVVWARSGEEALADYGRPLWSPSYTTSPDPNGTRRRQAAT